jgi:hypothetical protein
MIMARYFLETMEGSAVNLSRGKGIDNPLLIWEVRLSYASIIYIFLKDSSKYRSFSSI